MGWAQRANSNSSLYVTHPPKTARVKTLVDTVVHPRRGSVLGAAAALLAFGRRHGVAPAAPAWRPPRARKQRAR